MREQAKLGAGQGRVFATTDAREVMERADIDAVLIATSNHWPRVADDLGVSVRRGRMSTSSTAVQLKAYTRDHGGSFPFSTGAVFDVDGGSHLHRL